MASFVNRFYNKKKGNPQISQRADEIITKATKNQRQERRKQSVSSRSSPWEPGFKLKPRKYDDDEISDATRRGFEFRRHTEDGKKKSKNQLIAEIRRDEGRLDTADKITLEEELEKNRKSRSSQEEAETTRKSRSIASKLAAAKKAKEYEAKNQREQSMKKIIQNVYNTKVTEGGPGKSKIPVLPPEAQEQIAKEWAKDISNRKTQKAGKKKRRRKTRKKRRRRTKKKKNKKRRRTKKRRRK